MNKKYDKNELLLKNNIIHQEFFKENISKLESNNKEILYTKNHITKIKENDSAFQIFTKKGPFAFLPISKNQTSIVFSIRGFRD